VCYNCDVICATVWNTVYWGVGIVNVECCCASVWGTLYWGVCVL